MEAEASRLAASPRFRIEILPLLKSVTATPSGTNNSSAGGATPGNGGGISFVAPEITEATCVGDRYSYDNLQGLNCDEAKAALQDVSDTDTPSATVAGKPQNTRVSEAASGRRALATRTSPVAMRANRESPWTPTSCAR